MRIEYYKVPQFSHRFTTISDLTFDSLVLDKETDAIPIRGHHVIINGVMYDIGNVYRCEDINPHTLFRVALILS